MLLRKLTMTVLIFLSDDFEILCQFRHRIVGFKFFRRNVFLVVIYPYQKYFHFFFHMHTF